MKSPLQNSHVFRLPRRPLAATTALALFATWSVGCASEYTVVDRSALTISDNARVSATNLLPASRRNGSVVAHLALAQQVYEEQLGLLKARRNKVRARRRGLNLLSYGVMAATSVAAGAMALSDSGQRPQIAGALALGGAGLGTGFQIGGLMQEEVSVLDERIGRLQHIYDSMIAQVRALMEAPASEQSDAQVGAAVEAFMSQALQINVKG
jgi:hypothetical protein